MEVQSKLAQLEVDVDNSLPVDGATGGVFRRLEAGGLDGLNRGLIESMAQTVGDADNFHGARGENLDLDRNRTFEVHRLGFFRVVRGGLVSNLGRRGYD